PAIHSTRPSCHPHTRSCLPFFFNQPSPTESYTLSLHDALPICGGAAPPTGWRACRHPRHDLSGARDATWRPTNQLSIASRAGTSDRKSTRLNSSHGSISYAVFCLKKKKNNVQLTNYTRTSVQ